MKKSVCMTAITIALMLVPAVLAFPHSLAAPAQPDISLKLAGKTVFLDPGHQGGGTSEQLSRQVDNGRGATKECETTGMTALGGVPEHTITWKIARLVKTSLEGLGAKVVMSRNDDTSFAGCITDRAKAANASGAQIALSIHADGAPAANHGFHLIVPQLPIADATINQVQSTAGRAASKLMHDAYVRNGFAPASYAGAVDGIQTRADIAGPALTTVPDVFIEMGNGANPEDAKALTGQQGQLKHAIAITTGLAGYLLGLDLKPTSGQSHSTGDQSSASTSGMAAPEDEALPPTADPQTRRQPYAQRQQHSSDSSDSDSSLGDSVTTILQPLLEAVGVDSGGALIGKASDLAAKLLAAALENKKK